MAEHRRFVRPASTGEPTRQGETHVPRRGGVTSPSATSSSSSDDDEGGVLLRPRLASMTIGGTSSATTGFTPPHTAQGHNMPATQDARAMSSTSGFRGDSATDDDDGDVFKSTRPSTGAATAHMRLPTRRDAADRGSDNFGPQAYPRRTQVDESPFPGERQQRYTRNEHGFLASPEYRSFGSATRHSSTAVVTSSPAMVPRSGGSDLASRHHVGSVDAQAFYSPRACVFVANLPEGVEDVRLEAEVTKHFSHFGTVFVKIRRDGRNMPFAFCQYTNSSDAQEALTHGKGVIIHGRTCRTEMVRANRTYILHRANGDHLYVEEARDAMEAAGFGSLERCEPLPQEVRDAMGMSDSVLVELKKFDPSKELQSAFRHHPLYRISPYDPKKLTSATKPNPDEVWLQRYEIDRRSIFIGDLPNNIDHLDAALREVLDEVGDVVDIQVVRKDSRDGRPFVFAFAEFARPDMADIAVERLSGRPLFGRRARVERKACREVHHSRSTRQMQSTYTARESYQSPLPERRQRQQSYAYHSRVPATPLRENAHSKDTSALTSPVAGSSSQHTASHEWSTYGHDAYTSPEHYTTSPYAHQLGSVEYNAATPQMPLGLPAPAVATPYGYYPASNLAWLSPYLTDPNLASYAYAQAYGHPSHGSLRRAGTGSQIDTPTKGAGGERNEGSGPRGGDSA
ncbi:uncharacterized protein JN550_004986 [Neoarthrinium moseri]|uniref:uncharacterized protein n=1 Tax=Neoarthrinium moseri TaxID=1658444 RepID=UPI001FDCB15C|nr:uncharacterized protein JN550_004986 [Neoarthrinium moseri]KAI1870840.1 hypothetical protein JN550_004986 [Neoarthrinium moseri]